MVKDGQVRMLMRRMNQEKTLEAAAAKAGMTDKTARKYRRLGTLPSQSTVLHDWKTREDAFEGDWPWAEELLKNNAGLEAKTLFEALQREQQGQYQDGQLRTFQRRVKRLGSGDRVGIGGQHTYFETREQGLGLGKRDGVRSLFPDRQSAWMSSGGR